MVDPPKRGESKEDYLDYCIPVEIKAGKEPEVATAICNSIYRKEQMSKLRTPQEKFSAKLKYSQDFRGINLGEGDNCWDGYKQIGMKDLDGRQVPNCVKMEVQPSINSTYPGESASTGSK